MTTQVRTATTMFPFAEYADAHAAIDWLCDAFGFERRQVHEDGGVVVHAELGWGASVFMISNASGNGLGLRSAREAGGVTGGVYVIVDDVDGHHARAEAAGAEIVRPPEDTFYGSREYTARDLEGHLWSFGTYRPSGGGA